MDEISPNESSRWPENCRARRIELNEDEVDALLTLVRSKGNQDLLQLMLRRRDLATACRKLRAAHRRFHSCPPPHVAGDEEEMEIAEAQELMGIRPRLPERA